MSVDFSFLRIWRNRQTHRVESPDLRVFVGSNPTIRTDEMEIDMNESANERCSFTFVKDGQTILCHRQPRMELDNKKFCKLHGEVYILENFEISHNLTKDPDTDEPR